MLALGLWSTNSQAQSLTQLSGLMAVCTEPVGILNSLQTFETKGAEAADKELEPLISDGTCAPFQGVTPPIQIIRVIKEVVRDGIKATLYEVKVGDTTVYIQTFAQARAS